MLLDILLLIVIVACLGGVGWGWHSGTVLPASPIGIILVIVVIALLFGLIGPHFWGPYPAPPTVR